MTTPFLDEHDPGSRWPRVVAYTWGDWFFTKERAGYPRRALTDLAIAEIKQHLMRNLIPLGASDDDLAAALQIAGRFLVQRIEQQVALYSLEPAGHA